MRATMKRIKHFWASSPPEQKDYLFIYSWGALWSLVYLIFPPAATIGVFSNTLVYLWAGVTVIGAALGAYGLLNRDNLLVERFGVNLLMIGPLAFSLTQLGLMLAVVGDPLARMHLIIFALWPFLFLNKRRRQIKSRIKLVKQVPLPEESGN